MPIDSSTDSDMAQSLWSRVNETRLVDTATRLIAIPSPTGAAGPVSDELEAILREDGFHVERPVAGHPSAPAVVARFSTGKPGRILQFNGHLDTVHLPFVAPNRDGDILRGSGSADMKAGIAAAVEAMRAVRDADALRAGEILFTAHDLHESPWGDGRQLVELLREGHIGQAVLIPEYFNSAIAVIGRGGFIWSVTIRRDGPAIHEVYRPNEPSVIGVGAELVRRIGALDEQLSRDVDPLAGASSAFIGSFHSGSIYNEFPHECRLEGTRRWLPGTKHADADREFRSLCAKLASDSGTKIEVKTQVMRDAFRLDPHDPFVDLFQAAHADLSGSQLPLGGKPFVDDGNTFWSNAGIPAITHGPTAGGAHTTEEWVDIRDLVRVAKLYAWVATQFCPRL